MNISHLRRHRLPAVLLAAFVFLVVDPLHAAGLVYYVDAAGGNDANDGASAPWKTIQKAFNAASPGSIVYLKAGTYREALVLNVSGSAAAGYIIFAAYGADAVVLDATGITSSPLIDIRNKRYVRLQGLQIQNYTHDRGIGISITGGSDHVEIRGNRLSNMKVAAGTTNQVIQSRTVVWNVPIRITGNDAVRPNDRVIVDGNDISNCEEGWGETLTVAGNSTNWEITNNRITNCQKGIDAQGYFGDSSDPATDQARNGVIRGNIVHDNSAGVGVYVDGAKDVVIERNTVVRAPWGIVVSCEHAGRTATGIIVRDNLLYDNTGGLAIGGWVASYGRVADSQVLNNTIVNSNVGMQLTLASRITFRNNIVSGASSMFSNMSGNDSSSTFDYNLYFPTAGFGVSWKGVWFSEFSAYRQATGQDAHSLVADPLFVSVASRNFHLAATSPAVDHGDPTFVPAAQERDLDGHTRVGGSLVDIGADEFVSAAPPSAPTSLRQMR